MFELTMGQAWHDELQRGVERIGGKVLGAEYDYSSTLVVVRASFPEPATARAVQKALFAEFPGPSIGVTGEPSRGRGHWLSPVDRKRFVQAASDVYQTIGYDMGWHKRHPSKSTFFDVVRDSIDAHGDLTEEELARFRALPVTLKRTIVEEAR